MLGSRVVHDLSTSPNASPQALNLNLSRSRSRSAPRLGKPAVGTNVGFNENGKTQDRGGAQHVLTVPLAHGHDLHGDVKSNQHVPNERSPLLGRETNEIPSDYEDDADWRKELRVLVGYMLPVLGYALLRF
jgi:hypothetical protein